jgi:hypothetical protein
MRNFEFYEFAGVLTPGVITLVGLLWLLPGAAQSFHLFELSAGAFGGVLILAYAAGHLIQVIGNLLEAGYWWFWGGRPTDWVIAGKHRLISETQWAALQKQVQRNLPGSPGRALVKSDKAQWLTATRQIYAAVSRAGCAGRVDIFNGNYGLCRGMASAFMVLLGAWVYASRWGGLKRDLLFVILFATAVYRMHRFAVYYARELFVQFMQLNVGGKNEDLREPVAAKGAAK